MKVNYRLGIGLFSAAAQCRDIQGADTGFSLLGAVAGA